MYVCTDTAISHNTICCLATLQTLFVHNKSSVTEVHPEMCLRFYKYNLATAHYLELSRRKMIIHSSRKDAYELGCFGCYSSHCLIVMYSSALYFIQKYPPHLIITLRLWAWTVFCPPYMSIFGCVGKMKCSKGTCAIGLKIGALALKGISPYHHMKAWPHGSAPLE